MPAGFPQAISAIRSDPQAGQRAGRSALRCFVSPPMGGSLPRDQRGFPHWGQNFAPGGGTAPHFAHSVAARGLPHRGQNRLSGGTRAPHEAQ